MCHSLTMVNKALIAGHPIERSMFKLVEAHFLVRMLTLSIIRRRDKRRVGVLSG